MRCLIQKVNHASVLVKQKKVAHIGKGLLLYLAISQHDSEVVIPKMVSKITHMRLFYDHHPKNALSLIEKNYGCLLVSQFTLYADCKKGNRPFFGAGAPPEKAIPLYQRFEEELKKKCHCQSGVFGEMMHITSENDGPVTVILDSEWI